MCVHWRGGARIFVGGGKVWMRDNIVLVETYSLLECTFTLLKEKLKGRG